MLRAASKEDICEECSPAVPRHSVRAPQRPLPAKGGAFFISESSCGHHFTCSGCGPTTSCTAWTEGYKGTRQSHSFLLVVFKEGNVSG